MDPEAVEHLEKIFNQQTFLQSGSKPKIRQAPPYAVKVFPNMKVSENLTAKSGVSMY